MTLKNRLRIIPSIFQELPPGDEPHLFTVPIAHTSRRARDNEMNGTDYYFVEKPQFETLKQVIERLDLITVICLCSIDFQWLTLTLNTRQIRWACCYRNYILHICENKLIICWNHWDPIWLNQIRIIRKFFEMFQKAILFDMLPENMIQWECLTVIAS